MKNCEKGEVIDTVLLFVLLFTIITESFPVAIFNA